MNIFICLPRRATLGDIHLPLVPMISSIVIWHAKTLHLFFRRIFWDEHEMLCVYYQLRAVLEGTLVNSNPKIVLVHTMDLNSVLGDQLLPMIMINRHTAGVIAMSQ